ncbi:MAG: gliding motility-associated lipoprotein GldH [Bacteroidia bacterium]
MKKHFAILVLVALSFTACNENVLVDTFHEIPAEGWSYEYAVTDSFTIDNPGHYHAICANLRASADYPYANIHLVFAITSPDGETVNVKVPVALANKSGKWLGSGLGDVYTFQKTILHRKYFDQKGQYTVTIAQDMRLENLPSILAAGIRVEEQEEIY